LAYDITKEGNLDKILNRVSDKVSSSESRSLWEKMRDEMRPSEPDAAVRYIATELDRCKQDFESELSSLRDAHALRQKHA